MSTDAKAAAEKKYIQKSVSPKTFNKRLRELRERHNMSQGQLAEAIGLSRAAIYSYEVTDKAPSIDVAMRIAEHFKVSLDWLCGLSSSDTLKTYRDVAWAIHQLLKTGLFRISSIPSSYTLSKSTLYSVCTNNRLSWGDGDDESYFEAAEFDRFLEDYDKIKQLTISDTLTKDIFNAWLDRWLAKHADIPVTQKLNKKGESNADATQE